MYCTKASGESEKNTTFTSSWLPIQQMIDFKMALLIYKTVSATCQPSYLHSLISRYHPTRNLRSSSQDMLVVPCLTTNFGRRSFDHASAKIWNSLPLTPRQSSSTAVFNRNLKTQKRQKKVTPRSLLSVHSRTPALRHAVCR